MNVQTTQQKVDEKVFSPSEIHEIIAAVLRATERIGILFGSDANFREYKDAHGNTDRTRWVMSLYRKRSELADLKEIEKSLGGGFSIGLCTGTRAGIEHTITAGADAFRALPRKILYGSPQPGTPATPIFQNH